MVDEPATPPPHTPAPTSGWAHHLHPEEQRLAQVRQHARLQRCIPKSHTLPQDVQGHLVRALAPPPPPAPATDQWGVGEMEATCLLPCNPECIFRVNQPINLSWGHRQPATMPCASCVTLWVRLRVFPQSSGQVASHKDMHKASLAIFLPG